MEKVYKEEILFCVGVDPFSYREGEFAEIIGVAMVTPEKGFSPRPCFKVRFDNGEEAFIQIFGAPTNSTEKNSHYKLVTEGEIQSIKK